MLSYDGYTVKGNQPTLQANLALLLDGRGTPDDIDVTPPDHGRIETRRIGRRAKLNAYLDSPQGGQVVPIEREVFHKSGQNLTLATALGITRRPPGQADARRLVTINRGH